MKKPHIIYFIKLIFNQISINKIFKVFSVLILFVNTPLAQGWQWLNPKPFGDPILDVFFINENIGWMAPDNTTLLKTTNGGNKWQIIYTDILFENLSFINTLEGWGIGRTNQYYETNSIYHTIDGGVTWEIQLSDTSVRYEIFFINEKIGWATGTGDFSGSTPGTVDHYSHLYKTTDGGKTWNLDAINQLGIGDSHKGVHFLDSLKGWLVGGISYGVFTTDGGITWVRDSSLAGIKKIISVDSLHLWGLSDYDFIVRTTDGGISWDSYKIIDTTVEGKSERYLCSG